MQIISVAEAKEKWGDRVWEMDGMTWLANDPAQCELDLPFLSLFHPSFPSFPFVLSFPFSSLSQRAKAHSPLLLRLRFRSVLGHFFHVAAELLLGFWRTQAILDPNGNQDMEVTGAPSPSRLWFLRLEPLQW